MNAPLRSSCPRRPIAPSPRKRIGAWLTAGLLAAMQSLDAQSVFQETFTGTTANGWYFGGTGYTPNLTANGGGDTDGNGWLRLTSNAGNLSTYALLDTQIFSVGAQIQITMDYAFYNGSGADGITFFLVDGSTNIGTFTAGAYGGSLGYAQKDQAATGITGGVAGMKGGYLGFGFDNFGNYSNPTEGRIGGPGSRPNAVAVRGPESSGWSYINGATLDSYGQMDFPTYSSRPDQTGADYRSFRLTLDANNLLVVEMKFGASNDYAVVFTSNLAGYVRPETFKVGFTGATGGSTEIHEIRNLSVITTPGATIGGSYEWDDGNAGTNNAGHDNWGSNAGGEANTNWFSLDGTKNNKTPLIDSDIFFGSRPTHTSAGTTALARPSPYASIQNVNLDNDVRVKSLNFNSKYDYVLGSTTGKTITLGNTAVAGTPSIAVNDSIANPRFHTINNALIVAENLVVANQSHSTLTLNGTMNQGANTLSTVGAGQTNFNGVITGSGPIIATGASPNGRDSTGIVTLGANNATSYTGAITVNGGQLVALHNGALGDTGVGKGTTVNSGGTLTFRGGITTSENLTLAGSGTALSEIWNAGAVYNDGGVNNLNGAVTLAGDTTLRSRAGNLILNGTIGETGSNRGLTKTGDGVVTLASASAATYTGATTIQGGALRVTSENALAGGFSTNGYSGGNLALAGGVLEIGTNVTFTRQVGSGNDQVRWTGDGGFSASGADRTVTLTNPAGTAGGQLTWNSGGFVTTGSALVLGSTSATHTVTLTNSIDLGSAVRTIRADNGSAAVDGTLSGVLSGTGGINKTGDGTLFLDANNTYTGATQISGGALRVGAADRIDGSNITLSGGVLELGMNMTDRALGTGTTAIQWSGSGGFAAYGADRTVTLTDGNLRWTTRNFVGSGNSLIFGSDSATNTATLTNNIDLRANSGTTRTIEVRDSASATTEGRLSGIISSTAGGGGNALATLAIVGNGALELTGNNTYTGPTTITGASLRVSGTDGDIAQSSGVTISGGGSLVLDNTSADNSNRVGTVTVNMNAGNLSLLGRTGNVDTAETIGTLNLQTGANSLSVGRGSTNGSAQLTISGLSPAAGSTINITASAGTLGGAGDDGSRIIGSSNGAIANTNGILGGWATAGDNWATEINDSQGIGALSTYQTSTDHNNWGTTENISVSTAISMGGTGIETVNSLRFTGASGSIAVNDRAHRIASGGILVANGATATINADNGTGSLYATGASELFIHTQGTGSLTIQGRVTNDGSTVKALTKSGDGTLTLSGTTANTYTGVTTVNAGVLELNKSANTNAIAGNLVIGDTSGEDRVKILANEQIADTATVTLRGGTLLNNNHQAVLDIGNSLETFATLNITGNSVLDFSGGTPSAPSFLVIDVLTIAATDALLTVRNWIDASDYFLVKKTGLDSTTEQANINRIVFEGYGAATWEDYSSDYFMITPHASPVPEPASTGVLALGGLTGCALLRRRRRA